MVQTHDNLIKVKANLPGKLSRAALARRCGRNQNQVLVLP
jgi:hypothetical protein